MLATCEQVVVNRDIADGWIRSYSEQVALAMKEVTLVACATAKVDNVVSPLAATYILPLRLVPNSTHRTSAKQTMEKISPADFNDG